MRDYNEYYLFLNATPQSSQAEIDRAYQAAIGEARRQGGIMLDLVEEGYRCLSNPATRAQYHAGTYRQDVRVRIFRESNEREGRADHRCANVAGPRRDHPQGPAHVLRHHRRACRR